MMIQSICLNWKVKVKVKVKVALILEQRIHFFGSSPAPFKYCAELGPL